MRREISIRIAGNRGRRPAVRTIAAILVTLAIALFGVERAPAYSVLTHEQVVDLLWKDQIQPLLLKRFPQATEQDLREAHAYAYGGSMVQDMGYYPFGNKFFSDLLHYVRSGDFVMTLIEDSTTLNEYAFALGALAHYASDNEGHPTINHVVALEFPKLRKKYGEQVTYADDPKAHIRTEFGFDMVQVAKNRYTSDRYHDFIGFEVSQQLLDRAFFETYGLKTDDVFNDEDLAIGTFRWSVSRIIPQMTRVALLSRKDQMVREDPNFDRKKFLYYLSRTNYQKEWGKGYRRPGVGARILAFFLKISPKVGPFRAVQFKIPTPQSEALYISSVNHTVEYYQAVLKELGRHELRLENRDCDTGKNTQVGEYSLGDATYARLLNELADQDFKQMPPGVRTNILEFYSHPDAPVSTRKNRKAWQQLQEELEQLRKAPETSDQEPGVSRQVFGTTAPPEH